jgi:lipopolysaccharide biosynthesis glycosyltransferase
MRLAVAFCADQNMERPLHVAVSSVLSKIAKKWTPNFYFMLSDFSERQKDDILRTLDVAGGDYRAHFLERPPDKLLSGLRPLHGNMTPYLRLALPEHEIDAERLLYLDSDTISYLDITPLGDIPMPFPMGFVESGVVDDYPEKGFFSRIGLPPHTVAFNSGVMLFDLAAWRANRLTEQILGFCRRYSDDLVAADQTAMIASCAGNFTRVDRRYNVHLYASTPTQDPLTNPGIYHFVGSPKPWDIGGRYFHSSFPIYAQALANTVWKRHTTGYMSLAQWKRAYKIRGGYARTVLEHLRKRAAL